MTTEAENFLLTYLLIAPVVLFLVAAAGTYLFMRRPYPEDKRHKPR